MVGEDLSSSQLAEAPRTPLTLDAFVAHLETLATLLDTATVRMGMDRWFWGEGVCLLAAVRLARASRAPMPEWVLRFFEPHLERDPIVEHVNNLAPAAALAELCEHEFEGRGRGLLERTMDWCLQAPRTIDGALEHWPGAVWADTAYMAAQPLLRVGRVLQRDDLVQEAVRQWLLHAEALQDPATGLVAHGTTGGILMPWRWGRANAWMALTGADLLTYGYGGDEVRQRMELQLSSLIKYLPEYGIWDVIVDDLPETRGIIETSASAGLAAALLRAGRTLRREDFLAAGRRALLASMAYVDQDGWLTRVSAGTVLQLVPFGYSVIRDDRPQPWGQGLALEALAAWQETTTS